MTKEVDFASELRLHGLKATPQRIQVLDMLSRAKTPVGIPDLLSRTQSSLDTVTLYRSLETLTKAKIVRRVDLRHGHTDYELIQDDEHHHHLVCENCGLIEDIDWCPNANFRQQLMRRSSKFSTLTDHSLEFFGLCTKCVPKQ